MEFERVVTIVVGEANSLLETKVCNQRLVLQPIEGFT